MAEALSPEFKECLERGRIRRFASGRELAPQELKQAAQDLKAAGESYTAGGFKWSTIQSYYAMFHTARALLYQAGFRERSHFCLIVALRELLRLPAQGGPALRGGSPVGEVPSGECRLIRPVLRGRGREDARRRPGFPPGRPRPVVGRALTRPFREVWTQSLRIRPRVCLYLTLNLVFKVSPA